MTDITTRTIGKVLDQPMGRDAVHIALASVVATERLAPAQPVGLVGGSQEKAGIVKTPVGIVDPFLTAPVFPGERFWMFLYPMTITALRHEWEHPAFGQARNEGGGEEVSVRWLRDFAKSKGMTYGELMAGAAAWIESGEYLNRGPDLEGETVPLEFWSHYERATGEVVPEDSRESFFTCSC